MSELAKKSSPLSELEKQICPKVLAEAKMKSEKMLTEMREAEAKQSCMKVNIKNL